MITDSMGFFKGFPYEVCLNTMCTFVERWIYHGQGLSSMGLFHLVIFTSLAPRLVQSLCSNVCMFSLAILLALKGPSPKQLNNTYQLHRKNMIKNI